ncbi:MAG: sugar kinase, partial [Pseudomonadota bacterium]|nr:sugar kinase [Pseudomonadota bacterium]
MIVGIGEAMVEFAPVEAGRYARAFAGDTLNTAWYLARLGRAVGYFTRVGADGLSDAFLAFLCDSGIDAKTVTRDPERTMGLYMIELDGAERRFLYWRENSAARRLADDPAALETGLAGAELIHVSGITLAIIGAQGRENLYAALRHARAAGARVSFDPNLRRRLWPDDAAAQQAQTAMYAVTDIAAPSFDDEAALWGDASPRATATRLAAQGVGEIVVKNGAGAAFVQAEDEAGEVAASPAAAARDTTGAGD